MPTTRSSMPHGKLNRAQTQPEARKRFTAAQLRGQRDYYAAFQQNQGDKRRMQWVDPNDAFHLQGFDVLENYFLKVGTLEQKIDISKVIDPGPVEYALQRLGNI